MHTTKLDPPARPDTTLREVFLCPTCSAAAEVEWRDWARSTNGPVELVKIRCAERHWFLMPAEGLRVAVSVGDTGFEPVTSSV